jgi:ABC-type lipoprotein release transport system permease subunit
LAGLLFGVQPADPLTLSAVAALLTATAVAASYLPARQAARVDPAAALRQE